jgi:hypothetical protein
MSGISKKLMGTTAAGGGFTAIEDVFSTYLYTGNGSTQTITNGIDLAGEGGLVWTKSRSTANGHLLYDTERGAGSYLNSATATESQFSANTLVSFNADGFTLGGDDNSNGTGRSSASWTFRKAPRFFDVVTWTGDGVLGRTVSHNLGSAPGFIVIKSTSRADAWYALHKDSNMLILNQSTAELSTAVTADYFGDGTNIVRPTDTSFMIGNDAGINGSGETYVAYLFAHDPLGPSGDGSDGLIACGSYTGNGSTDGPEIDLGWEPQWVLVKNSTSGGGWVLGDVMRGLSDSSGKYLYADASDAEVSYNWLTPKANGFKLINTGSDANASGDTHIYIAIRRGPMRAPTSGTEVFLPTTQGLVDNDDPGFKTDWPVDFAIRTDTDGANNLTGSRLTGIGKMYTDDTGAENTTDPDMVWDFNNGWWGESTTDSTKIAWLFRRAPAFFDAVAYSGDGVAGRTVPHNLGVAPEMMIVKSRTDANSWYVYTQPTGNTGLLVLNSTTAAITPVSSWNNTSPTNVVFSVDNSSSLNGSGITYIAYLFATLPGVSKVGSFTATGSVLDIDCGFTSGARFVLIKRTDTTGEWFLFDTARGITISTSPWLPLNTSSGENIANYIDPLPSGFRVTTDFYGSGDFIFLAIA